MLPGKYFEIFKEKKFNNNIYYILMIMMISHTILLRLTS